MMRETKAQISWFVWLARNARKTARQFWEPINKAHSYGLAAAYMDAARQLAGKDARSNLFLAPSRLKKAA
jgi:hypothetical protein